MRLQSLRSKLLLAVFLLVIGSGVAISFLVTRQYGQSLLDAAAAQAEHQAHALALSLPIKFSPTIWCRYRSFWIISERPIHRLPIFL